VEMARPGAADWHKEDKAKKKSPCHFHFGGGKGCRFSAENCRMSHAEEDRPTKRD
jgi:hypothetical protein